MATAIMELGLTRVFFLRVSREMKVVSNAEDRRFFSSSKTAVFGLGVSKLGAGTVLHGSYGFQQITSQSRYPNIT